MKFLKIIGHIIVVALLTGLTQIGGLFYILSIFLYGNHPWKKYAFFFATYFVFTLVLVPVVAPFFGRERIKDTQYIKAHSYFYKWTNRNYVQPEMNRLLLKVSSEFSKAFPDGKITYMDANFPFINKFPLVPHLSHNDGKKLDISLVYSKGGEVIGKSPSVSGYGVFEEPRPMEYNQIKSCKNKGHWQYDFQKYLSLGRINDSLQFSEKGTKKLLELILKQPETYKVFIEPHLKYRMRIAHVKMRYHGCHAVRHDDHIHLQIK